MVSEVSFGKVWEVGRYGCQNDELDEAGTIGKVTRKETREEGREGGREGGRAYPMNSTL